MTTGPALTEVSLPSKESASAGPPSSTFSSSRLLSKLARSPTSSRRDRVVANQVPGPDSAAAAAAADSLPQIVATTPTHEVQPSKRNQPRPGFQRQVSAADTSGLLSPKEDASEPKDQSDAPGNTVQPASTMLNPLALHTPSLVSGKAVPPHGNMFSAPLVSEYYYPHQIASNGTNGAINYMYQQFHDLSQKRIATLQYMRKAYEGKLYWLNTVHFSKRDIEKFPSHMPNRLSRRAINFFLLGISIPNVLDVHQMPPPGSTLKARAAVALEIMKSLNTLLAEFESYQEKHPMDGSHAGSLSRARLPSMFKRSGTTSRPRKSSTAPAVEIGTQISPPTVPDAPHHHSAHPSIDTTTSAAGTLTSTATTLVDSQPIRVPQFSATATFPPPGPSDAPNSSLLPNEAPYTHLLTPPLPFAPDFYCVFATLCDVLIDIYQRLLQIISGPGVCSATIAELFSKTDARIRRVMVGGIIRDFETASRENAKRELAGVQKVVLGGLMG